MDDELNKASDAELSALLGRWKVEGEPGRRFSEQVWRRIGEVQSRRPGVVGFWGRRLSLWEEWVRRPWAMAACLVLFTALGVGLGVWRAEAYAVRTEAMWQHAYVASVSPLTAGQAP